MGIIEVECGQLQLQARNPQPPLLYFLKCLPAGDERMEIIEGRPEGAPRETITTRYLTKYEKARVLGTRALQISMNAPVMVEVGNETGEAVGALFRQSLSLHFSFSRGMNALVMLEVGNETGEWRPRLGGRGAEGLDGPAKFGCSCSKPSS